jgi:hypothetical protein
MERRHLPIPRSSRRTNGPPSGGADPFSLADPPAVTAILGAARSPTSPSPTSASRSTRPGRGCPRLRPRLHLHQRSAEEAGSRRCGACGRASARCARRAHERRGCLVQLPGLDRHRSSPLSGNTTALSKMINPKMSAPPHNPTMRPEPRPSSFTPDSGRHLLRAVCGCNDPAVYCWCDGAVLSLEVRRWGSP